MGDQPSTSEASQPSIRVAKFAVYPETCEVEELRVDSTFVHVDLIEKEEDENQPSTSSAAGNNWKSRRDISACFPNVYQEKFSKYQINYLSSRPPAEFLILNSVSTEDQTIKTKLFIPAGVFPDSCWLRDAAWTDVSLSFLPSQERPEFVIGQFSDSSFQFRCSLPATPMDVQELLQTNQPFMLSEQRLLQIFQCYQNKSFCSILTRHGRSHQTLENDNLGYEWIKLMFSQAEREFRVRSLFKSDPWFSDNNLNVSLIEEEVFSEVDISKVLNIPVSSYQYINYKVFLEIKSSFQKYEHEIQLRVESRKKIFDANKKGKRSTTKHFLCFPFFRFEKDSSYHLRYLDVEKLPKEFIIFTSFRAKNQVAGKLFIHKSNFYKDFQKIDKNLWEKVSFNYSQEFATISFPKPSKFKLMVRVPVDAMELQFNLKHQNNFYLPIQTLRDVKSQYQTGQVSFCSYFSRNGENKLTNFGSNHYETQLLGCDWIKELFSDVATSQRVEKIKKIIPITNNLKDISCQIEKEAFNEVIKGKAIFLDQTYLCSILSQRKSKVWALFFEASSLFERYETCVKRKLEGHLNNIVKNVITDIQNSTPVSVSLAEAEASYLQSYPCPFNSKSRKCYRKFYLCSHNDLICLSEHVISSHLSRSTLDLQFNLLSELYQYQAQPPPSCPLPGCGDSSLTRSHYQSHYKLQAFCFFIFSCKRRLQKNLLTDIKNVMTEGQKTILEKYLEHLGTPLTNREKNFSSLPVIKSVVSLCREEPQDQDQNRSVVKCLRCEEIFSKDGFLHRSHLDSCKLQSLPNFPANSSLEDLIEIEDDDDEGRDSQAIVLSSDDETGSCSTKQTNDFLRGETTSITENNVKTGTAKVPETQSESQEIIRLDDEETFDKIFGIVREEEDPSDQFSQLDLIIQRTKRRHSNEDNLKAKKIRKPNDELDIPGDSDSPRVQYGVQPRDQESELKYFYFCLDCESHLSEKCSHMTHPRVPIGINIAGHFSSRGHSKLQAIGDFVMPIKERRLLALQNVSYSKTWSSRVRKCWKKMVLSGGKTSVEIECDVLYISLYR